MNTDDSVPSISATSEFDTAFGGSDSSQTPEMRDVGFKGRVQSLKFLTPRFRKWNGPSPQFKSSTLRSKPLVHFEGKSVFAEIAVVGGLERLGWNAVWLDCFHRRARRSMGPGEALGTFVERAAQSSDADSFLGMLVKSKSGKLGGLWDIFAWRGGQAAFFETKRRANDRLRASQLETYVLAQTACPQLRFFVVEWDWQHD